MLIGLRWTHKTRIVEQNAFNGKYVEGVHCFGMFELWLSILKVVAEGLTAAFGILGLLTSFRNEVTKNFGHCIAAQSAASRNAESRLDLHVCLRGLQPGAHAESVAQRSSDVVSPGRSVSERR